MLSAGKPLARAILGISLGPILAAGAGCGGSGSPEKATARAPLPVAATPIANATGIGPSASHAATRAEFVAFARAVNLRPGDVPGFGAKPKKAKHFKLRNKAFEGDAQYRRCLNTSKFPKAVFKEASDEFKAGRGLNFKLIHSQVEVAPTAATAQHELSTIRGLLAHRAVRDCLTGVFDRLGRESQPIQTGKVSVRIVVGGLSLAPLQVTSASGGTDGGFGLSMRMAITYVASFRGRTLTFPTSLNLELLAFLIGRGEVTLAAEALGEPPAPELVARLYSLLVSRATAARQAYPALQR